MKKNIGYNIENFPTENKNVEDKKCPFFGEVSIRGKTIEGVVESDKMNRTVKVSWSRYVRDIKYKRYLKKSSSVLAHNSESIAAKVGDKVLIAETRPISKRKHFTVLKILERGEI